MAKRSLLAARIFGTPLLIAPSKLDAILGVVGPRLGLDLPSPTPGPETEPKQRAAAEVFDLAPPEEDPEPKTTHVARLAVVQVVGSLAHRVDALDAMSGMSSYETMAAEIDRLAADPEVDGILVEVDSFGGEAAGCFDLADRIFSAREQKPVFGVANQFAMSAGYALLSQCDQVWVPQSGEVGSIGVVSTHVDLTGAAAKEGVRVTHVYAGAHKVDMSSFVALSDETKARLAADVEQTYQQFVEVVARGGRLDADAARATEALTFIGERAVAAGLANHVGTRETALQALAAEVRERKHMKELEKKVAEQAAQLQAAQAKIVQLEAEKAQRLAAEDSAYLEHLRAASAQAQAPIPEERIQQVKGHMDAGRREIARELGDLLLEQAEAKCETPLKRVSPEPPTKEGEQETAASRGLARLDARRRQAMGERVKFDEATGKVVPTTGAR